MFDITYCSNTDCPFTDCIRHLSSLKGERENTIISIANFGGVCRQYLHNLIETSELEGLNLTDGIYQTDGISKS